MDKTKSNKEQSKGKFTGEGELVKIGEAADNDNESNASPTLRGDGLGGTLKDIKKRQGLDAIDEDVQGAERDGAGFRDSELSVREEDEDGHGELYNRLWGHAKFSERQPRTVYKQIGIDPDQHYEEEEL